MRLIPKITQRGEAFGVVLLALLLVLMIVFVSLAWSLRVNDETNVVGWKTDMINSRAAYNAVIPFFKNEAHARSRTLALAVQQMINESTNPGPSRREGFNKYQERQLAGAPELPMAEARIAFETNLVLSRVGFEMKPNPWPRGSDEYLAGEFMRDKMRRTGASAYMHTSLDCIKPASEFGFPHDDRLSDWVYGVRVAVQVVSETRLHADGGQPPNETAPTIRWQPMYGDVRPTTPNQTSPSAIPVADDARCLSAGSPYSRNQCGSGRHLVFNEYILGDEGELNPFCSCETDSPAPPSSQPPGQGRLVFIPQRDLMEGKGQFKFAGGLKSADSEVPPTPGIRSPVHYYDEPKFRQRGRFSGQFNFEFWVRFAKPILDPDGGPENQVPLDSDVCADESCLPPPGGCVTGWNTTWNETGDQLITTITTTCGIFSESTQVGGPADQADYSGIIRDHTAYLNSLWASRDGATAGYRRAAGNNGNGQPMGTIAAGSPPRDTASSPIWSPVFSPAPQSQSGIDPARMRTFSDLQMHFDPLHEESPRYLRIAR